MVKITPTSVSSAWETVVEVASLIESLDPARQIFERKVLSIQGSHRYHQLGNAVTFRMSYCTSSNSQALGICEGRPGNQDIRPQFQDACALP